jgi:hypothetical protein
MRRIIRNPVLGFPLCVALAMALGVAWSLTRDDRLVINQIFLVVLALIPLSGAGYAIFIAKAGGSGFRKLVTWVGTVVLGGFAAFAVFFASGILLPYNSTPSYNYAHFHYAHYIRGGTEQRVFAGDQAVEETLYNLEGNPVSLSELWRDKPIVVEFGSIT